MPSRVAQTRFWDEWNLANRASELDLHPFQLAQLSVAVSVARRQADTSQLMRPLRILDFGCGTGWLGASLRSMGEVTGVDLSEVAIDHGRHLFADVRLLAGHFSDVELDGGYDLVLSADVLAHVDDQGGYVERVADLLRPGGVFFLMTQNSFVWRRSSYLVPQAEGQIRNWPRLGRIRELLAERFQIDRVGSIDPGGDRGVLRMVNNRVVKGGLHLVGLGPATRRVLEQLRVGRELTIEARTRP